MGSAKSKQGTIRALEASVALQKRVHADQYPSYGLREGGREGERERERERAFTYSTHARAYRVLYNNRVRTRTTV